MQTFGDSPMALTYLSQCMRESVREISLLICNLPMLSETKQAQIRIVVGSMQRFGS
jgi:hypothetical protein